MSLSDLTTAAIERAAEQVRFWQSHGYTRTEATEIVKDGSTLGPGSWARVLALLDD